MNKKIAGIGVVIAVVAVVAVALWVFLGGLNPPVDVYARSTPPISESPFDLLPESVANSVCEQVQEETSADSIGVVGFYFGDFFEGEIVIGIYRFSSSGAASSYLDEAASIWRDRSGSTMSQEIGEVHWCTHTESGWSIFGWRKGVWLFLVTAPTETLRNQVVEELSF
jgi:hypothetical protein